MLQAYARWGCDCFQRFDGMWALNLFMHWVRPDPSGLVDTMRQITWHRDDRRGCGAVASGS